MQRYYFKPVVNSIKVSFPAQYKMFIFTAMKESYPQLPPPFTTPRDILEATVGTLFFYDNFVVVNMKEGVTISYKTGVYLLLKALKNIGVQPFMIVSDRKHSYSIDPVDYKYLNVLPNLKGIAVVCYTEASYKSAMLESNFIKKPFKTFENLDDAVSWTQSILENN